MSRRLESQKVEINRNAGLIYNFLSNFDNFNHVLPSEVVNWQSSGDACSFEVKGLATIGLRIIEKTANSLVRMKGEGKIPFAFSFDFVINEQTVTLSEVQIQALADMNPFIAMMAEKPLLNLMDEIIVRLKQEMEK